MSGSGLAVNLSTRSSCSGLIECLSTGDPLLRACDGDNSAKPACVCSATPTVSSLKYLYEQMPVKLLHRHQLDVANVYYQNPVHNANAFQIVLHQTCQLQLRALAQFHQRHP